jgi:transcriptional regulator with XRE-family HTH domain
MAEDKRSQFARWLRDRRRALGQSQQALADLAECSRAYLSKLEAGVRHETGQPLQPTRGLVVRLARALGASVDEALLAAGYAPERTPARAATGVEGALRSDADLTPGDVDALLRIYHQIKRSRGGAPRP